jgi:SAM-dependent methyltransferase
MADAPALVYPNRTHEGTHPDRLAARARLFGVEAAPATKCRVLELGCAGGANLVAMASDLPESTFVGIDLSEREIAKARALAAEAGTTNVRFEVRDVMDVMKSGELDFIVAHGLYSWVAPEAQRKILAIIGEQLAPNGVAYVAYNTLPGWYTRAKARDLMLFHTQSISDPQKKVEQGLAALKWLSDAIGETTTYGRDTASELALLRNTNVEYIFQEHFVDTSATYFHEFVATARAAGLEFLAESEQTLTHLESLPPSVREVLAKIDDAVRVEQYIDFVTDRRFRATLLCRASQKRRPTMDHSALADRAVSARCALEGDAFDLATTPLALTGPQGARAQIEQPVLKVALGVLASRAPEAMTLDELATATRTRIALSPHAAQIGAMPSLVSDLAGALLRLSMYGFVKSRGFAATVTPEPSDRPVARTIARLQSKADTIATSVWHESVHLTPLERSMLPLLDGTRDRAALAAETRAPIEEIDRTLARLARAGVLVA